MTYRLNTVVRCMRHNRSGLLLGDKICMLIFSNVHLGKLIGHLFTIVDITINEKDQHIISLSTARVFRIWDIHTLTSLQVWKNTKQC